MILDDGPKKGYTSIYPLTIALIRSTVGSLHRVFNVPIAALSVIVRKSSNKAVNNVTYQQD